MPRQRDQREWERVARAIGDEIGREVVLARSNFGLSRRAAARIAHVSPSTQTRVERGDPSVGLDTSCRVASAVGLKLWARAFPASTPSLRDTGQLRIAEYLRNLANPSCRVVLELGLGNGRSADEVFFGATEIIDTEIERLLGDFQGQYRPASAKRDELAKIHQRPVRLVLAVEDTRRNRAAFVQHEAIIRSALPAGSREVLHALRTGEPLGRDGLLWVRPQR
jgi:transcriptional regulator with XRE-family HTH domain